MWRMKAWWPKTALQMLFSYVSRKLLGAASLTTFKLNDSVMIISILAVIVIMHWLQSLKTVGWTK